MTPTKQDIEMNKAAEEYAKETYPNEKYTHRAKFDFIAGVRWADMHPYNRWHPMSERPEGFAEILLYNSKEDFMLLCSYTPVHDNVSCDMAPDGESWDWDRPLWRFDMWCYIKDIKPIRL